jgi:DNA-binding ferritin-like protein
MMRGTAPDPQLELQQSQDVLKWALRKHAPDSSFAIKAMIDVADQLARHDRVAEELVLREQAVTGLRHSLGPEHSSTINAEWKLATCLTVLERPEGAEPLLAHVVAAKALALGEHDPETLAAMAWRASVAKQLGRVHDARDLQEEVVAGYERRGDGESAQAMMAALNLASTLTELDELAASAVLLRHVLQVRSRTLGPDDPRTLDVLHVLASVLFESGHVSEARSVADDVVERRSRVLGLAAEETVQSLELLASIDAHGDTV